MLHPILENIGDYLKGRRSLRDLETWLLSNLQAILDSREQASITLANAIDADLIELGDNGINEEVFRERLAAYVKPLDTVSVTANTTQSATSARDRVTTSGTGSMRTVTEWVAMPQVT